jgi:hypothetical protein
MTHKESLLRKLGLPMTASPSLDDLSRLTGVSKSILQRVYNRGIGAYKTNPQSVRLAGSFAKNPSLARYPMSERLSKEQWAFGRLYSFLDKGRTYYTADADLAREARY